MPAPDAIAATMAMACKEYSRGPAYRKILYKAGQWLNESLAQEAYFVCCPRSFLFGDIRLRLLAGGGSSEGLIAGSGSALFAQGFGAHDEDGRLRNNGRALWMLFVCERYGVRGMTDGCPRGVLRVPKEGHEVDDDVSPPEWRVLVMHRTWGCGMKREGNRNGFKDENGPNLTRAGGLEIIMTSRAGRLN